MTGSVGGLLGAALSVAIIVAVLIFLFALGYEMLYLQRRFKDHVSLRARLSKTRVYYPMVLRDRIDWRWFLKAEAMLFGVGFVVGFVGYLLYVGFVEVFL